MVAKKGSQGQKTFMLSIKLLIFEAAVSKWSKLRPIKLIKTGWKGPETDKVAGSVCDVKTWVKRLTLALLVPNILPFFSILPKYSSRQFGDGRRRCEVSQRWLARLAQSWGIKQSVTQPVTIALITPSFNTSWKECKGKTATRYLCRVGFAKGAGINQSWDIWDFRSYQNFLFPEVKLTTIVHIVFTNQKIWIIIKYWFWISSSGVGICRIGRTFNWLVCLSAIILKQL